MRIKKLGRVIYFSYNNLMIDTTFKFVLKIDRSLKFSLDKNVLFPLRMDAFIVCKMIFISLFISSCQCLKSSKCDCHLPPPPFASFSDGYTLLTDNK